MSTSEKAKVFMFVCIGLAALAVAANQWVPEVTAQVGDNQVVAAFCFPNDQSRMTFVTAGGDIYGRNIFVTPINYPDDYFQYIGNVFNSGGVPIQGSTLGGVKGQFR